MFQALYQVRLKDVSGNMQAIFTQDNLLGLRLVRRVNWPSTHEIILPGTDPRCDMFEIDGRVEVWRKLPDTEWALEYEGFHRDAEWRQDADGAETFTSRGTSYLSILARRVIAEYSGTERSKKSGPAETVAKAFVTEQIVSPTIAERAIPGFTVESDGGRGNTITIQRSYRNLLEVLQEIARIGGGDFDVVFTDTGWEFRWYDGQRGTDRRGQIIFSTSFGNMIEPRLTLASPSVTAVLVAGGGEGTSRMWMWRPATPPSGLSRVEIVRDARDTEDQSVLIARGDAELEDARGKGILEFKVLQTHGAQYGRDYFLGDLVTAVYRGVIYELKIVEVDIELGAPDEITVRFEEI